MIKTVVIPQNNSYNIAIPANYIGKKIEIRLCVMDEAVEEKQIAQKSLLIFWEYLQKRKVKNLKNIFNKCVANGTEISN
jgi:hypothetical protein